MRRGYPEVSLEVVPQERWVLRESLQALRDELACAGGEEGGRIFGGALGGGGGAGGVAGLARMLSRDATPEEEAALAEAMDTHGMLLFQVRVASCDPGAAQTGNKNTEMLTCTPIRF